jgi:dienelactone hydrolase
MKRTLAVLLLPLVVIGCHEGPMTETEIEPLEAGPYRVGSSNLEVAAEFADIGDEAMHDYLLGRPGESGQNRYLADILKHPGSALIVDVPVPDDDEIYGPARGLTLPVVSFVTFPTKPRSLQNPYTFPYHDGEYGAFEDMLGPGQEPNFADSAGRYPLIILAHGASAHGIYDIGRAHNLARHGYIVAVITYGDDRTSEPTTENHHVAYLRPLITKAVLDALLASETYGPHIDTDNIGIAGHSFGGFTSLAVAGGPYLGNTATVSDERIKAASVAAPWVGGNYSGRDLYAFGPDNSDLARVDIPVISFFGTRDEATLASFILPAMKHLSGPVYVVELVDQPHVFEAGSWQDRDNWETLFFAAYLKHDIAALASLETGRSMQGGNQDRQLFDYQRVADGAHLRD